MRTFGCFPVKNYTRWEGGGAGVERIKSAGRTSGREPALLLVRRIPQRAGHHEPLQPRREHLARQVPFDTALVFVADDGGRVRADVGGLDAWEAGVAEPLGVLGERVGVARFGVDEHVEGEDELVGRACARVVGVHGYDDDAAPWPERAVQASAEVPRGLTGLGLD